MGFWSRAFSWFGGSTAGRRQEGKQSSGNPPPPASAVPVNQDTALQLSTIWACTKIISETVAGLPIKFYKKLPDGTRVHDPDFYLSRLLNGKVNRWQTGVDFKNTVAISESMLGNAYSLIQRGIGNKIIGLVPLMAAQMEVKLLKDGSKVYCYTDGRAVKVYSEKSIWHTMMMPSNAVIGLSPLTYAARAIGIATSAENRVGALALNGFKPAGVLMYDKILTPDQREQIRNSFSDLQEGQGDPLRILEADMTYQQVSISPKDAQLLETRQFSVRDLCRFWGVNSVLVNDTEAGTTWGSGIQQIFEGFYKLTIRPYLERSEASIKENLLTSQERVLYDVEYDFSSLLRADEKTRIENATKSIAGGLKTVNEARLTFDGSKAVDGGETIYMQQQMTPIEELKNDDTPTTTR